MVLGTSALPGRVQQAAEQACLPLNPPWALSSTLTLLLSLSYVASTRSSHLARMEPHHLSEAQSNSDLFKVTQPARHRLGI